jgi:hypothetical protein
MKEVLANTGRRRVPDGDALPLPLQGFEGGGDGIRDVEGDIHRWFALESSPDRLRVGALSQEHPLFSIKRVPNRPWRTRPPRTPPGGDDFRWL